MPVLFSEAYTKEAMWLFRYLKDKALEPDNIRDLAYMAKRSRSGAFEVFETWVKATQNPDDDRLSVATYEVIDRITEEEDWDLTEKIAVFLNTAKYEDLRDSIGEMLVEFSAEEAPSWAYMTVEAKRLLPNQTWLIHFSDDAAEIARHGFKYGVDNMAQLGLTTYFSSQAKAFGGYDFAFDASDTKYFRRGSNYGKEAVIFQSSGVYVYHSGDQQHQVIFWGPSIKPSELAYVSNYEGSWHVNAMGVPPRDNRDYLYSSEEITAVIDWIKANNAQYRKQLYGK